MVVRRVWRWCTGDAVFRWVCVFRRGFGSFSGRRRSGFVFGGGGDRSGLCLVVVETNLFCVVLFLGVFPELRPYVFWIRRYWAVSELRWCFWCRTAFCSGEDLGAGFRC
ncbi:hypothetical protein P8452_24824 [Trifolium repens]|nr:hypothetical protein P8452_24824 [Trifolium repens]